MNKPPLLYGFVTILLLFVFPCNLTSQENRIDSIRDVLVEHEIEDTIKVNLLNDLATEYLIGDIDKALEYAEESLLLSEILDFSYGRATSLQIIGDYYYKKGNYNRAFDYYTLSLESYKSQVCELKLAKTLHFIGLKYNQQGNFPKALEYYQKALDSYELLDNRKGIYRCLIHTGILYLNQDDYIVANQYFEQALSICKELDDKAGISVCLNNIGNALTLQKKYSKAIELFKNALDINTSIGNKKSTALNLGNIGEVYYNLEEYDSALSYYGSSLKIYREINNKTGICYSYIFMGAVFLKELKFYEALEVTQKGLNLAKELNLLEKQKEIYKQLADIYYATNKYKKAFESYVRYKEINDSIFNEESIKAITSLENSYKFEKEKQAIELEQQKKDAVKAEEEKLQKNVRNTFIAGFVLMVILVLVISRSFVQKRRANRILTNQKKEIEEKNLILVNMNEEIKSQSEQLKSASEKLIEDEQFVTMGKLIAGISHEVNTPLGIGVTGSSLISNDTKEIYRLLKDQDLSEDELIEYLEKTKENSDIILSNLIKADNHIGGLKKISRDQVSELPRKFLFKEYLDDIIQNLKHEWKSIGEKDDLFHIDCDQELEVNSLPGTISQIFTNLIMNSIRHGYNDQDNFTISISVKDNNDSLSIIYTDNGVGIKEEYLPDKIFKAFFTTKLYTGGSGLGLFIVKDIIEKKLKGSISCESEYGTGIKFTILITLLTNSN